MGWEVTLSATSISLHGLSGKLNRLSVSFDVLLVELGTIILTFYKRIFNKSQTISTNEANKKEFVNYRRHGYNYASLRIITIRLIPEARIKKI